MRKGYDKIGKRMLASALALVLTAGLFGCGEKKSDANITGTSSDYADTTSAGYDGCSDMYTQADCDGESFLTNDCMAEEACYGEPKDDDTDWNTNEYNDLQENSWSSVQLSPLSTFAADVDTASYTNIRSNIEAGREVPASSVRIEEMINYFHYDYETPKEGEKFAVYTEYADCPWNKDTKLALVSLGTEAIDFSEAPASNLVFLVDVSGSMFDSNKLPLVQQSLCLLAENLTEKDRVSIVTYAGSDAVVLEGVTGDNYYEIASAVESLEAYGSTNGSAGISTAYGLAEKYFIPGGNNRVILATDGDLNVGITSEGELEKLITEKKKTGVYLSVLGVGYGNYKDNKLETLADKGNGNYAYIDSVFEAKKALVDDMGATMVTVAKDVKLQVEFNPENVKGYRLIGYENRVMAAEDFNDDTKDGGEMGAGHSVTALYEIIPADSDMELGSYDLKYGTEGAGSDAGDDMVYENGGAYADELFTVSVRYKEPEEDKSKLFSHACNTDDYTEKGSDNLRWAAAVAGFGMYLKDSQYMGTTDPMLIMSLADSVSDSGEDDYKKEFMSLVKEYTGCEYGDIVECY